MHEDLEQLASHHAAIGAVFLDVREPGWPEKIYTRINVLDRYGCPFGQVYTDYVIGRERYELNDHNVYAMGFSFSSKPTGYMSPTDRTYVTLLDAAWNREVERRRV